MMKLFLLFTFILYSISLKPQLKCISTSPTVMMCQYVGCFTDDMNRDLSDTIYTVSTLEECQSLCSSTPYFSLQSGDQCMCGNSYATAPQYYQVDNSECTPFNNGRSLNFGGNLRNAIYKKSDYVGPPNVAVTNTPFPLIPIYSSQYIGCFVDDIHRDIADTFIFVSSATECQFRCSLSNKEYFALQMGNECFCGNAYSTAPQYTQVSDTFCEPYNHGRPNNYGGYFKNAVYRNAYFNGSTPTIAPTDTPSDPLTLLFVGCFIDDANRDMTVQKDHVYTDIAVCQSSCSGYLYFSIQYGHECFCGNAYSTEPQYSQVDNSECVGMNDGRTLWWGNSWRQAIYRTTPSSPIQTVAPTAAPTTVAPSNVPSVAPTVAPTLAPYQYLGCYIDDSDRDMAPTYSTVTSIVQCQFQCVGFSFFALQAGFACFCANAYATEPRYARVPDYECSGTVGSSMGNNWRNAVFIILFFHLYFIVGVSKF